MGISVKLQLRRRGPALTERTKQSFEAKCAPKLELGGEGFARRRETLGGEPMPISAYFPLPRRLLTTMARETRELAGMRTAARSGLIWPVRQRAMATVL